ncbi:hypothetical protein ACLOJK_020192 [Asimina triloba]
MAIYMIFGFLPSGGFAINNHHNFDRSIPYYFMMVLTTFAPKVYKKETFMPTPITPPSMIPIVTCNDIDVKMHKKNKRQRRQVALLLARLTKETIIVVS